MRSGCIHEGRTLDDPRRARPTSSSSTCVRRPRWRCCSPICPRRCRTRSRSPSAAICRSRWARISCRSFRFPEGMTIDEFFRAESRKGPGMAPQADPRPGVRGLRGAAQAIRRTPGDRASTSSTRWAFPGYFLIVADFIQWAKDNDVRWGRGGIRRRLAGRLCAEDHRSRPAPNMTCCSSASSTRNASPCPTSTSTSAWTSAIVRSTTSPASMARFGIADHHLRLDGRQGGGARCRARAWSYLWLHRPRGQDGAVRARDDARQGTDRKVRT